MFKRPNNPARALLAVVAALYSCASIGLGSSVAVADKASDETLSTLPDEIPSCIVVEIEPAPEKKIEINPETKLENREDAELPEIQMAALVPPPAFFADLSQDGLVNVDDLLEILKAWGACQEQTVCTADIAPPNGDGMVGVDDMLEVLSHWGSIAQEM